MKQTAVPRRPSVSPVADSLRMDFSFSQLSCRRQIHVLLGTKHAPDSSHLFSLEGLEQPCNQIMIFVQSPLDGLADADAEVGSRQLKART